MKTIPQLIQMLHRQEMSLERLNQIQGCITAYKGTDWKYYARTKTIFLYETETFKLKVIFWEGLQKTYKHGHPYGGGFVKLLSGILVESRFDIQDPEIMKSQHIYSKGAMAYIHDNIGQHIIENPTLKPAVSLHFYTPAIYGSSNPKLGLEGDRRFIKAA